MDLTIDHVSIAGEPLEQMERQLSEAGLPPTYGGVHDNDATHMSTVGFADGSYLELISALDPDTESPWWNWHIHENAGPCAWAAHVEDVEAAATEFAERGIPVAGPDRITREREDGVVVEFELAFLGGGEPGTELPFLIGDVTPRERRIAPDPATEAVGLEGVAEVVLGVPNVGSTLDRFRHAFDVGGTTEASRLDLGAVVHRMPELPVSLALPVGEGWLADRVHKFEVCPCCYLLAASDFERALDRLPIEEEEDRWNGRRLAWFDEGLFPGGRLGILGPE
ncbi:MAG: VOC family protein [Halobacteriales archaeon]|nr:VOC family protein [Halobacteriales archaeon]